MRTPSVRRGWKPGLASLAIGALALGGAVTAPLAATAAEVDVTGVTFDWGMNSESGGGGFAPGTCNFFSAGVAGDSGSSRTWGAADQGSLYATSSGNTTIVKPDSEGAVAEVTWDNKCTTPTGARVTTAANSTSGNRVQIANGSGTVDVDANTAEIRWDGSFTVVYYSGYTYWTATDPILVVNADGTGTVTATGSGYGTSMEDQSIWEPIAERQITLATLTGVEVTEDGITVTPEYRGVEVNTGVEVTPQTRSGANWGSFPQDFVDFQVVTGQSSYWYSSGGSADPKKPTTPLTVSYDLPVSAVITAQPTAQSVSLGAEATFSVTASDATGYQWQSAATGSSTWANIDGATTATYKVVGTTEEAKQYRVVVAGAGGPVTSEAATLTVNVPTPTVTVSKTAGIDPAGEIVTVTGTGFLPNGKLTNGARPPLAGKFGGSYVALSSLVGSTYTNKDNSDLNFTKWAVLDEDKAAARTEVVIAADGTFSTQIKAQNFEIADGGVWGIRTYTGSGGTYAAFSTFTPLSFAVPVADAPAAPTATIGEDGTSIDVTWTAPADNGAAISGYDVTLTPSTGAASTVSVQASILSNTFSGLTRGVSYTATVVAKNAGGSSEASAASDAVTIAFIAPAAPAAPTVTAAGTESINVSWAAPDNGGTAITGYTVTVATGGDVVATVPATGTTASIAGLSVATEYSVTVTATNAVGTSAASAATTVRTLAEAPGSLDAPTVTVASGTSVNVSWVAPAVDGGSAVTGYVVSVRSGSTVATTKEVGVVTTTTVDGLLPGTEYTVTVAAKNAEGTGAASAASAAVRTWSAPSAPAVNAVLDGTTGVSATWSAPADGGSAVTGYTATLITGGSVVQTKSSAVTSVAFDGLTPGGVYSVSVTATNGVGTSTAGVSDAITVPAVAPAAPGTPAVTAGTDGTSVSAVWTAPLTDGGSPITGYSVALSDADGIVTVKDVAADVRNATFSDLPKGDYRVTVAAVTAAGSAASVASAPVHLAGPAPQDAPAEVADSELVGESGGDAEIVVVGSTVTIDVGAEHANTWVGVTIHSDPVFLGWFLTDAAGVATVTLPAGLPVGTHHVVVQAEDGTVLGYQAFTIAASGAVTTPAAGSGSTAGLAATGADGLPVGWVALSLLLLVIGGAVVLIARRKALAAGE